MQPVIVVNMKVYPNSIGKRALDIARSAEKVSEETGVRVVLCPPHTELYRVSSSTSAPCWAQSADAVELGAHTGAVPLEAALEAGAKGVLLNHSEKPLRIWELAYLAEKAKVLKLETCVCANSLQSVSACIGVKPSYIAYEPPELIGGDMSVTKAKPDIVQEAVNLVRSKDPDIAVLCGAGVKKAEDVSKAIELGTVGVLVASGVVASRDPYTKLMELAGGATKPL